MRRPSEKYRNLVLTVGLLVLAVLAVGYWLGRLPDLESRAALVGVGMTRGQVEQALGPPAVVLNRSSGQGVLMSWVDQLWQVDVLIGPDGRVESVARFASDSFYRRTVGRLLGVGHAHPHRPAP